MVRIAGFDGMELQNTYYNTYDQGRAIIKAWKAGASEPGAAGALGIGLSGGKTPQG
jgi:hypothetical protein